MSYLVLARKWRPRRFAELVGQEHVVRALGNALGSGRVHHAFLFTGTRGVGKTTIARIFAKSLNCEQGVSAEPCGECAVCTAVDAGRFVDLLEIDAASNTGIDDVREVIENAQYMPTRGRYKVYLIDEVHMLSKNAFNALLKTLEEPPGHVKFLLATTDPQKLPVTVLSRCLQFNLKRLTEEQIAGQLTSILAAEGIEAEAAAIAQLSRAADGSLRDGLSLLDQAIAYGDGRVGAAEVEAMLGTVDRGRINALLDALAAGDGDALLAGIEAFARYSPDFEAALDEVATLLHRIQVAQLVPAAPPPVDADPEAVARLAAALAPEIVQLWYQMALNGGRDLSLAPTPRIGFEMALLRMLAFRPQDSGAARSDEARPLAASAETARRPAAASEAAPEPAAVAVPPRLAGGPAQQPANAAPPPRPEAAAPALAGNEDWLEAVASCGLRGPARELAANAAFVRCRDGVVELALPEVLEHLKDPRLVQQLAEALGRQLGAAPRLAFVDADANGVERLVDRENAQREQRQSDAEADFLGDPSVRRLIDVYGARPVQNSIRPFDEA